MKALLLTGTTEVCRAFIPELAAHVSEWRAVTEPLTLPEVLAWGPDVTISYGYRHIVTPDVLAVPKLGSWNLHPSLLPVGRGAHPIFWSLAEGQPLGVSVHEMNKGLDTGRILAQTEVTAKAEESLRDLYAHAHDVLAALFWAHWPKIARCSARGWCTPQRSAATYHRAADLERYWPKLPAGWDTAVEVVQELGLKHATAHAA